MKKLLVIPLITCLITSCALMKSPQKDPTRYYVLKGNHPSKLRTDSRTLVIGSVSIPAYLEHKEIVTGSAATELHLAEYHLWAEPLDKAISRIVAEDLSLLLNNPAISPDSLSSDAEAKIHLVIRRFERSNKDKVILHASYTIRSTKGGRPHSFSREITVPVQTQGNYTDTTHAMSQALGSLSKKIARDFSRISF